MEGKDVFQSKIVNSRVYIDKTPTEIIIDMLQTYGVAEEKMGKQYSWQEKIESLVKLAKATGRYLTAREQLGTATIPGVMIWNNDYYREAHRQLKEAYEEFCQWRHDEPYVLDELQALLTRLTGEKMDGDYSMCEKCGRPFLRQEDLQVDASHNAVRPMKFRAWHKHHKFMFQVMEVTLDAQYASGFSQVVAYPFDDWNRSENEQGTWANNAPRTRTHYLHREIDSLELMQYTGLKDSNDRDIYEGDVVGFRGDANYRGVVRFGTVDLDIDAGACETIVTGFYVDTKLASLRNHMSWQMSTGQVEILGTIYENPEILPEDT